MRKPNGLQTYPNRAPAQAGKRTQGSERLFRNPAVDGRAGSVLLAQM